MEENNVKEPDKVLNKDGKEFKAVKVNKEENTQKMNWGKQVFMPFVSGVLGAGLVLGICLGVPDVRTGLLKTTNGTVSTSTSNQKTTQLNTTQLSLESYSEIGISVAQKVLPSIVGIKVEYPVNSIFVQQQQNTASAQGSGIIISEDGYILTNNHVINSSSNSSFYSLGEATKLSVYLYNDETEYEAKVVGTDEETDLAVIKIEKEGLQVAELGDSSSVAVGEFAMAVGNPLGMQSSVTAGMIGAVDREITDSDGKTYKLIQTDAAINSGNSGGPLVNINGEVIGITSMKLVKSGVEGMGFALPIEYVMNYVDDLENGKQITRPVIGVSIIDSSYVYRGESNVQGVVVASVENGSSAYEAGLKKGDIVTKINDSEISSSAEFRYNLYKYNVGDTIKLVINRSGETLELNVKLN